MADTEGTTGPPNPEPPPEDLAAPLGDDARTAIRAHASPEGIVTILFTDIVESTRFRQRVGDAAAQQRMRDHNAVSREQIIKHGGFEVKTQGDGFMVAFSDVVAALACSVDIQHAVTEDNEQHLDEQLHVRMGLNCGQVLKEEADFFGGVVIVAARISAMAKGDQILVSDAVRVLAGLPKGIGYVRYGRRHLKGLDESYGIWSVPWSGIEPRGFAKLRGNAAFRVSALTFFLVVIGGGVIGGLALAGAFGGDHGGIAPNYRHMLTHHESNINAREISGRCLESDLIVTGDGTGAVTGDITALERSTFTAVLPIEGRCGTVKSHTSATFTDAAGNGLSYDSEGVSTSRVSRLGTEGKGASSELDRVVLIITDGSGTYAGITGKGVCTSHSFLANSEPGGDTSLGRSVADCEYLIAPAAEAEPLIVEAVGGVANTSFVFGRAAAFPTTIRVIVLYRNARNDALTGVSLRLRVPETVKVVAEVDGQREQSSSDLEWPLADLPGGTLSRFEMTLRVNSADEKSVTLVPELRAKQLSEPARSDPVEIAMTP
jgi:class 3 adenylate cyclase